MQLMPDSVWCLKVCACGMALKKNVKLTALDKNVVNLKSPALEFTLMRACTIFCNELTSFSIFLIKCSQLQIHSNLSCSAMGHLHCRVWSWLRSWSRAISFTPNPAFVYPSEPEQVMNTTDVELDKQRQNHNSLILVDHSRHHL